MYALTSKKGGAATRLTVAVSRAAEAAAPCVVATKGEESLKFMCFRPRDLGCGAVRLEKYAGLASTRLAGVISAVASVAFLSAAAA